MKRIALLLFFLIGSIKAFAYFPLTHIYIAALWCEANDVKGQEQELVIKGSVFPDICKISDIPKSATHAPGDFALIGQTADRFQQGVRLHHYADGVRKQLAHQADIDAFLEDVPASDRSKFLQLLEDEYVYKFGFKESCQKAFTYLSQAELAMGIDQETLEQWNAFLLDYLSQRPSDRLAALAEEGKDFWGIEPERLAEWSQIIPALVDKPDFLWYFTYLTMYYYYQFNGKM